MIKRNQNSIKGGLKMGNRRALIRPIKKEIKSKTTRSLRRIVNKKLQISKRLKEKRR